MRRLAVLQAVSLVCVLTVLGAVPDVVPEHLEPVAADVFVLVVVAVLLGTASAPWNWAHDIALERRFGRQAPSVGAWAWRHGWHWILTTMAVLPVWLLFQWLQRELPWLTVPVMMVAVVSGSAVLLGLAPWLITWSPRVTPIADEALAGRLHALVGRAGLRVAGLHAWRDVARALEPNAALVGAGPGRRLLLSTALLETFPPDDIEVVVAHELGHHARGHIWRRLRMAWLVASGGLAAAQVAAAARVALTGRPLGDAAALPVVLLAVGVVVLAARPRMLAQSRAHELEADAFALDATGRPEALERVLTRLGAHYKAAPEPSPFEAAFFLTHPPVRDRVAQVRAWRGSTVAGSEPIG